VSHSEVLRSYPCDAFVASPTLQAWRGVPIATPTAERHQHQGRVLG
jgi:hypothetical protein